MSVDVPTASRCVSQDDCLISGSATVCVACAPSTTCSVNALDEFCRIMRRRRQHLPPGLWILILHTRAPLMAEGRPQDAIAPWQVAAEILQKRDGEAVVCCAQDEHKDTAAHETP